MSMLRRNGPLVNSIAKYFLISVLLLLTLAAQADSLEEQRKQYRKAREALSAGNITLFKKITASIQDYPLYPYLLYNYLRPRLWQAKGKEVGAFLKYFGDLPMAEDVRATWLKILAQRGRWQDFMDFYAPQDDETLRCYHLQARIKTHNEAYLLEDARTLWLAGKSQPPQCDPAFEKLAASDFMTDELVWQRIKLAMANGETSLAKYLSRRLNKTDQEWTDRWIAVHHNPARWTGNPKFEDTPIAREILVHGIKRLARIDTSAAVNHWESWNGDYSFTPDENNEINKTLAAWAVINKHKRAKELMDNIDNSLIDEKMFHWRLRNALENNDWSSLVKWTEGTPPDETIRLRWLYWRARALELNGRMPDAEEIYRTISGERDYYGFLAADRVGIPYNMNHISLPEDLETWNEISGLPAIVRARELYLLGSDYAARREWHHALNNMTSYQMQIASAIAANWGWHDRVILTLGKAGSYDDLILRFPIPFEEPLRKYADMRQLDLGWTYALTRAESAFMADARSPAGALGLMQVMPDTGRQTAKAIGFRTFDVRYLLEADKNITIGSAYLKQMYDRFNGNLVLATAAYNAGPGNVSRWLPKSECVEPDIWIEKIPFEETRKYVSRILFYAAVYDWRLQQDIIPVRQRMTAVQPNKKNIVAALSCGNTAVSQN